MDYVHHLYYMISLEWQLDFISCNKHKDNFLNLKLLHILIVVTLDLGLRPK
jgi:hypothetical protein